MERRCEYCNQSFVPKRTDAIYCSHSCRQMSYVLRKSKNVNPKVIKAVLTGKDTLEDDEDHVQSDKIEWAYEKETQDKIQATVSQPIGFVQEIANLVEGRNNSSVLGMLLHHTGYGQTAWVSIRYKCLLECLLMFSETAYISTEDLKEVCNAFTGLVRSDEFQTLPDIYPYIEEVIKLRSTIKTICISSMNDDYLKFRLKKETKLKLIASRWELSQYVPKRSFNELSFDE